MILTVESRNTRISGPVVTSSRLDIERQRRPLESGKRNKKRPRCLAVEPRSTAIARTSIINDDMGRYLGIKVFETIALHSAVIEHADALEIVCIY